MSHSIETVSLDAQIAWLDAKVRKYMLILQVVPENGPRAVEMSRNLDMVEAILAALRELRQMRGEMKVNTHRNGKCSECGGDVHFQDVDGNGIKTAFHTCTRSAP